MGKILLRSCWDLGKIRYFIILETNPGGMFAIDETTGNITLVKSLDRQTQSFYALLVSVSFTTENILQFGLGSLLCFEGLLAPRASCLTKFQPFGLSRVIENVCHDSLTSRSTKYGWGGGGGRIRYSTRDQLS